MAQGNRLRPLSEEVPQPPEEPPSWEALQRQFRTPTPPYAPPPQWPTQEAPARPQATPRIEAAATSLLLSSLRTLSQRSLIALGNLFVLLTLASAWYLWYSVLPKPSVLQLVGLGLYAVLVLVLDWMILRRR